jgi:hypothetical protein
MTKIVIILNFTENNFESYLTGISLSKDFGLFH